MIFDHVRDVRIRDCIMHAEVRAGRSGAYPIGVLPLCVPVNASVCSRQTKFLNYSPYPAQGRDDYRFPIGVGFEDTIMMRSFR